MLLFFGQCPQVSEVRVERNFRKEEGRVFWKLPPGIVLFEQLINNSGRPVIRMKSRFFECNVEIIEDNLPLP